MKNKLKKVVAYVLSFMMLFTMSAMNIGSVSAASTGSITLNVAQHDIGATTFSVYKLMDATSANDKIAYTVNSDFKEFFKQTDVANSEDDEVVYNYIKNHVKNDDFTTKLKTYVASKNISKVTLSQSNLKANNLEYGYYAIIPSIDTYKPMYTTLSNSNQTVYLKGLEPDVDKKADGENWTSAQIGETVRFTVDSMVPNMTGFDHYVYKFTDEMSSGLTVSEADLNMKITMGDTELTAGKDYTVTVKNQKIIVDFGDFIKYKEHANETLKFEYQATLNSNAVTDDKTTNTATIQYGHDVNSLSDPKTDKTIIKTHNLKITKVEKNTETPLAGAKFNLYKGTNTSGEPIHFVQGDNGTYTVTTDENGITELVTPSTGIINVKGLDDGDYRLVETEAPEGYNKLKSPKEINIKADSSDNGVNVTVSGNEITVENSTESWLPETGGMGTVIFTIVGVVGVLVILSTYFKKGKKEEA